MGIDTGLNTSNAQAGSDTSTLERETGIEPVSLAWKAKVLPLNYSRRGVHPHTQTAGQPRLFALNFFAVVEEAGFEPA
jgi:hypothetical protein